MKNLNHSPSMPVLVSSDDESTCNHSSSDASISHDSNTNESTQSFHRSGSSVMFSDISNSKAVTERTAVAPHVGYKKVLVTGGAGFIGSNVAEYLLSRGDDVVIVDEINDYYDVNIKESNIKLLQESYPEEGRVTFYRGDICDEELMENIFKTDQPKWVCHMAARAGVRPSIQDPFVYIHSNIKGTTQLMELSHKYGVENFVFAFHLPFMVAPRVHSFRKRRMSTIQSVHMLPAKRPANYLPTPTIIYTSSIFLVFDSSQYTDLVDDPIWHPSSLLIVSAVELKCSSMVMAPPVVITLTFLILLTAWSVRLTVDTSTNCLILERVKVLH